jgi:chromosome segregation ATPase
MRKILRLLGTVLLICFASCDKKAIEDLQSRLDQLEKTTLVSIQSQMASAQKSIVSLEEAKRLLQEQIDALAAKGASMSDIVNALNTKFDQYSGDFESLKALVYQNVDDVKQWMEQASATLGKITTLESELKDIQDYLKSVEDRLGEFKTRIDQLYASMQ